ncbi:MAG: hypothetical protein EOO75_08580 [Myxococcales bacterium]|nr:MAG: hypothetical protein EOO75_08580 [Myxococcales bacterium]
MQNAHTDVPDQAPRGPGLSPMMREATLALAEAIFTTHAGPPPRERLVWLADELDHFLGHAGTKARLSFQLCLTAVSTLAPPLIGRRPPLAALAPPDRLRALERMEQSPAALALFGAKTILCLLHYEHPDAARENGFDDGCLGTGPAPRIVAPPAPDAATAAGGAP